MLSNLMPPTIPTNIRSSWKCYLYFLSKKLANTKKENYFSGIFTFHEHSSVSLKLFNCHSCSWLMSYSIFFLFILIFDSDALKVVPPTIPTNIRSSWKCYLHFLSKKLANTKKENYFCGIYTFPWALVCVIKIG
jgi:hypothetical protein